MEVIFVLIPVSVVLVMIALWAFVWSANNGQYEDMDKEANRILFEGSAQSAESNLKEDKS